ncbi:MAG: carboxypeptidase-like regulatory domain-containing protein, partial [Acidobacteria bacterium]|nr:carboxypeptidase-like regulatory domain-containing protein [Acidobacteriota bacterium]
MLPLVFRKPWLTAVALACLLVIGGPAVAQEATGNIGGRVLDATKAPIPGAAVTATRAETGEVRKTITDDSGAFAFPALQIGNYQLSVTHTGFKNAVKGGMLLHIGDHLEIDIALELGAVSQQVNVVADAPQVQIDTSEQGGLISGEQVRDLQLNGRSFMSLVELLPGVVSDMPDRVDPNTSQALYINGARSSASSFNIDGGNNQDVIVGSGSMTTFTSLESIAEFKVITSTFAAEYGKSGVAHINVVTRGGTR